jgi:hypothetical protein
MQHAESILVIIVSSLLSLVLIAAVVAIIIVVRLVSQLRKVVNKAEQAIDSAEAAASVIKNVGGPLSVLKILDNVISTVKHKK